MNTDDLDDVERVAVQQGVAEQATAEKEEPASEETKAEEPEDDGDDLAAETAVTKADGEVDDEVTQSPADTEQENAGAQGVDGEKQPEVESELEEVVAEPPRARRVYLPDDVLIKFCPPGAVMVGDHAHFEQLPDQPGRAYLEIEGEGADVEATIEPLWDEHHGDRRILVWK